MKHSLLFICVFLWSINVNAQTQINGKVQSEKDSLPIVGALIKEENSTNSTQSDTGGNFSLTIAKIPVSIIVSYMGYESQRLRVEKSTDLIFKMKSSTVQTSEVVVSASRYRENIASSPATIYKINANQIQNSPTGDFYGALSKVPDIEVINNSFNFKILNTRGFNTTSPFRIVQLIDGIDNISPVLSLAPGAMGGVPDINIDNIELISGPSSALYGPNALQGVVSIRTKDAFTNRGLSAQIKGGNQNYIQGQIRYADVYGRKQNFGLVVSGDYYRADDWRASDAVLNNYKKVPYAPQNLTGLSGALANDTSLSATARQKYIDFNAFTAAHANTKAGTVTFTLPGYDEKYLATNKSNSLKLFTSLTYKITPTLSLTGLYKFDMATAIYQGNNRAFLNDYKMHQAKLELKGKHFFVRSYVTQEDLGNSYDLVLTGINMGIAGQANVSKAYLNNYIDSIKAFTNNYANPLTVADSLAARRSALSHAQNAWLQPGTAAYSAAFDKITSSGNRPTGSRYTSQSLIVHLEGQYDYTIRFLDINAGASFRRYMPTTHGQIFADTLLPNGKYAVIAVNEFGGFLQLTGRFLKERLKVIGSLRVDKSQNYNVQFSPRVGIVFTEKKHTIRASFQSAFRSPSLNDQFFLLNAGSVILKGNLSGNNNLYTSSSVAAFTNTGSSDTAKLITYIARPVAPEHVLTTELGYRLNNFFGFSAEVTGYYNQYTNFIGSVNVAAPKSGIAGQASGVQDIKTRNYYSYRMWVNSTSQIATVGLALSISYTKKNITPYFNYTFNKLVKDNASDDLIPGFNTPPHKINIGINSDKVWKGLGFSANFRWSDSFYWESSFANGPIRQIHTLDLEAHYEISKIMSILRVGCANVYNNKVVYAAGAAEIGAFVYGSWTFHLKFKPRQPSSQ